MLYTYLGDTLPLTQRLQICHPVARSLGSWTVVAAAPGAIYTACHKALGSTELRTVCHSLHTCHSLSPRRDRQRQSITPSKLGHLILGSPSPVGRWLVWFSGRGADTHWEGSCPRITLTGKVTQGHERKYCLWSLMQLGAA